MTREEKAFDADYEYWQACVVCKLTNGNFALFRSLSDIPNDGSFTGEYQNAKWKWNKGKPIVDFGDFQMNIADVDLQK